MLLNCWSGLSERDRGRGPRLRGSLRSAKIVGRSGAGCLLGCFRGPHVRREKILLLVLLCLSCWFVRICIAVSQESLANSIGMENWGPPGWNGEKWGFVGEDLVITTDFEWFFSRYSQWLVLCRKQVLWYAQETTTGLTCVCYTGPRTSEEVPCSCWQQSPLPGYLSPLAGCIAPCAGVPGGTVRFISFSGSRVSPVFPLLTGLRNPPPHVPGKWGCILPFVATRQTKGLRGQCGECDAVVGAEGRGADGRVTARGG